MITGRLVGVIGTAAIPTDAIASSSSLLVIFLSSRAVCFGRFDNCSLLDFFGRFVVPLGSSWTVVNFLFGVFDPDKPTNQQKKEF